MICNLSQDLLSVPNIKKKAASLFHLKSEHCALNWRSIKTLDMLLFLTGSLCLLKPPSILLGRQRSQSATEFTFPHN